MNHITADCFSIEHCTFYVHRQLNTRFEQLGSMTLTHDKAERNIAYDDDDSRGSPYPQTYCNITPPTYNQLNATWPNQTRRFFKCNQWRIYTVVNVELSKGGTLRVAANLNEVQLVIIRFETRRTQLRRSTAQLRRIF